MGADLIPETPPTTSFRNSKTFLNLNTVSNYESKALTSLVCEFNRCQTEAGHGTVCSSTVLSWLKEERPKVAIYPHQSDYCDYCIRVKKETQACQQKIACHLQSGSTSEDVFEELKKEKEDLEKKLEEHRKIARESLQYYHQMKGKVLPSGRKLLTFNLPNPLLREMRNCNNLEQSLR